MIAPGLAADPEWKQYLRLGEQLMNQADAAAQCQLIEQTLNQLLGCLAKVWLASAYYPLPGQPQIPTLPDPQASDLVAKALDQRSILYRSSVEHPLFPSRLVKNPRYGAFPLVTRDVTLGILEVSRPQGPAFRPEELTFLEGLAAHAALSLEISRQVVLKNWRYEQLSLVRSVSAQIASVLDLDQLCGKIVDLIQQTFDYRLVSIYTLESPSGELRFRASAERPGEYLQYTLPNLSEIESLVKQVVSSGQEQIYTPATVEARLPENVANHITRSQASLPIKLDTSMLGVLDVHSDRADGFHEVDLLVLRALADSTASAIESARLYGDLKRRSEQIASVFEITHNLTSILDLDSLLQSAVEAIHRLGYAYVHLFAVHGGRRIINYLTGSGARTTAMKDSDISYCLDDEHGLIPWVARNNRTYLANDTKQDKLYRPSLLPPDDTRSELTIPLTFSGEVLGVLDIQSDQVNAFDPEELPVLEALAASLAIAMHNANSFRTEQWHRQVAESFRVVASLLSSNLALDKVLEIILQELERNLPCEASAIWLVDDVQESPTPMLNLAAVRGISSDEITQTLQNSPQAHQFIYSALGDPEPSIRKPGDPFGPLGQAMHYEADYSSIAAPLSINDQPIGVLTLAHHSSGRYGNQARLLTKTFASYAAVSIQVAQLYNRAQEQAWISTILLQMAEASQSATTVDELLSTLVHLTRLLIGIKKSAVYLYDAERQTFSLRAWYGLEVSPTEVTFPPGTAPALDQLRAFRETIFVDNAARLLNLPAAQVPAETGTLVLLPLLSRDELLGAFLIAHETGPTLQDSREFNQQTLAVYQGIAHQTAVALENMILYEARQEEAYVTAVLLQVAQAVVSQNDLVDILDTIVHLTPILVGIDACIIYLWDGNTRAFRTVQAFTGSLQTESLILGQLYAIGEFDLLDNLLERDAACYTILPDADTPPTAWKNLACVPIDELEKQSLPEGVHWIIGFPLTVKGEMVGAMLTKERTSLSAYQQRRLEIMNGIAQQVALAVQNDRLRQEAILQERINREVQLARQIQQSFLPGRLPNRKAWEMAARWQPALEVGGDFYDIFSISKERLAIAIADVSDKGMPAALYMTVGRTLIRAYANNARSAAHLLQRVNTPLVTDTPNSMFITAVYVILWPENGSLLYANAGHNRPYILRANQHVIEKLPKGGIAMGVLEQVQLENSVFTLEPGDCLFLYTDGVTDSFSPSGESLGEARLENLLEMNLGQDVNLLLDNLQTSLLEFRAGMPPFDDVTMVAIRYLPQSG